MPSVRLVSLGIVLAIATADVAAQTNSLLFVSRYDSMTSATTAGLLGNLRPFDIAGLTPGTGASAHPWVPAAGISATIGDPDDDNVVAEFSGLPQARFGIGGLFIKHNDRDSGDPRRVFWTVRVTSTSSPKLELFSGTGTHSVRPGDFVRLTENGEVEFFIKQEHFVTAAGPQKGNHVKGAGTLCQASNGDLFYSPPNGVSASGSLAGGHWVNQPSQVWCNDGGIVRIPNSAITYDTNGNVKTVKASSAKLVVGEVGGGPNGQPSIR